MYFRSSYIVRDFGLRQTPEALEIEKTTPPPIKVVLRPIEGEELKQFYEKEDWVASVTTEEKISANVAAQFDEDEGEPTQAARDVSRRVADRMRAFLSEFLRLVRWRSGIYGHHEVIRCAAEGLLWSRDDVEWQPVRRRITVRASDYAVARRYDSQWFNEIRQMMMVEEYEPVSHELLREAWNLRHDSLRSALMLGVSAMEVGVKAFIAKLVPQSEWLCFELPAPPVVKMLREYISRLPVKLRINGEVFIPEKIVKTLEIAVRKRNSVAHKGDVVLNHESLAEILMNIQMALYFLDYYAGYRWALNNIRDFDVNEFVQTKSKKPS